MDPDSRERDVAALRRRHPGWFIWYVPRAGGALWCAQRRPIINCETPDLLSEAITRAEEEHRHPET